MNTRIIPLSRYEKEQHLQFLSDQIKTGEVDKELIPYLSEINSIEGICTTLSCAGHKKNKRSQKGYVRLRLSTKMMRKFRRSIPKFYECQNIGYIDQRYHLGKRYRKYVREAGGENIYEEIMISFLGLEGSPETFHQSIKHIVGALKKCTHIVPA